MGDTFSWFVIYDDGTIFTEEQLGGFGVVDLSKVKYVGLQPNKPGLPSPLVKIDAPDGQRPIFFRRTSTTCSPVTGEVSGKSVSTCLGWQRTVNGKNVQALTFFFDDGSSLITDDYQAI